MPGSSRVYTLEFLPGVTLEGGTYDSAGKTYDEATWTYDQQSADPFNYAYEIAPFPAWRPGVWEYRVGDVTPAFEAVLIDPETDTEIDYSKVASAVLFLVPVGLGAASVTPLSFSLTVGADKLSRTWAAGDLNTAGTFIVLIKYTANSGRSQTVSGTDKTVMRVTEAS